VKRVGVVLATAGAVFLGLVGGAQARPYKADRAVKLDVLGEWAHPDDDTSIIGPCGVWHDRFGVRCGIIQVTRGEGGGNAVGQEIGPALGLRRENEDRVAHFRSGTVDLFYLDRVDFFYNQSAPLTQDVWGHDETLGRITRIIRMTQPDIYIGFTPTLNAGHGNHQQAGRFIWEGVLAAADPHMFPEQLRGPHALSTWQVKKVFSGGNARGTGGAAAPDCTTGFTPDGADNVAGVWTGYDSPFAWPAGNVQGRPAGTPKPWAQVFFEGIFAYPTQSREMYKAVAAPSCSRFAMTDSYVPFQPNVNPDGSPNARAGRDDAILLGATRSDPGGLPLGTTEYLSLDRFYNAPGAPFTATLHVRSGGRTLRPGTVTLTAPAGWSVDAATKPIGRISARREATVSFTVTPSAGTTVNADARIAALLRSGGMTGYTDDVVRVVAPAEGRFERWGKWKEYDGWLQDTAPQARRLGRSAAIQSTGAGETLDLPVVVHNWSDTPQSGTVTLTLPPEITASGGPAKAYGPLAPGADATVHFTLTNTYTNTTLPGGQASNVTIPIATTYSAPAGSASETLTLSIVPTTSIPATAAAPVVDGVASAAEYPGPALDVGRQWEPDASTRSCSPPGVDCGSSEPAGGANSTYAKVTRSGDDLYFFVHVKDDFQSYAIKPSECVAHWLADSVEILIDPRGTASQALKDTANTFKLGVFPFTDDPTGSNGNGANGPCWERDADNHQGYATGPLAATVPGAPNAPGVEVASTATWVDSNETTTPHAYAGGGYELEVKIPLADLPAAVDPDHMGLNITPYDEDDTAAPGTTTLRHIDQSTRLAWSTFGSVQSDPYRWGHATLPGYTPPPDRPTEAPPPTVTASLNGVDSPQTIAQSVRDGVPIASRDPAPRSDRIADATARLRRHSLVLDLRTTGAGRVHAFLWSGETGYIPVFLTSCSIAADPPPDYGLTACAQTDGGTPPWGADMSGRIVAERRLTLDGAARSRLSIPLTADQRARLASDSSVLVSFETPAGEVQALDVRLRRRR
jgi:LmbE family N-acetylglucosaminyl deacetylase